MADADLEEVRNRCRDSMHLTDTRCRFGRPAWLNSNSKVPEVVDEAAAGHKIKKSRPKSTFD